MAEKGRTRWSIAGWCVFAVFAVWAIVYVPPEMDEFSAFHRLACSTPNGPLNSFRESCDAYPLRIGPIAYHRAYAYIGATSGVIYEPFWRIWPDRWSFYGLGLGFLIAFGLLLTKTLRLEPAYTIIPLCYFPIAYSILHDTGPSRLGLLSIPILALITRQVMERGRLAGLAYAVLAAALVVACVEDKSYYLLIAPMIALIIFAVVIARDEIGVARTLATILPAALVFAVLTATAVGLLLLADAGGDSYLHELLQEPARLNLKQTWLNEFRNIVSYTTMFPLFGHRVFNVNALPLAAKLAFAVPTMLLAMASWTTERMSSRVLVWLGVAYAAGALALLASRLAWAGHHYVFLHVPIVVALMLIAGQSASAFRAVAAFVCATTILSMAVLTVTPTHPETGRDRLTLFAFLNRPDVSSRYVVNFSSYGGYYYQSLYGNADQVVTFAAPLNDDGRRVVALARSLNRGVLDLCTSCDPASIASAYGATMIHEVDLHLKDWHAFEVTAP